MMKAAVLRGAGREMSIEDIAVPRPDANEVVVRVSACGVCHSDLHVLTGDTPFPRPCVLGHEISGTIVETGADVQSLSDGQRVVSSFLLPCGRCRFCADGEPALCVEFLTKNRQQGVLYDDQTRHYTHDGDPIAMYSMGGFAEYCVVPANDVFVVPDEVNLIDAAVLGCSVFTGYSAVKDVAGVQLGETVAVIGAGGVGSGIIQLARAAGAATVIAVDIASHKLQAASAVGATHQIDAADGRDVAAAVREITGNTGVDLCFEAIGALNTVATAVDACGDGGRTIVVGLAPAGGHASVDIARMVRRKITLCGSYAGNPGADMPHILHMTKTGIIDPARLITNRYSLNEINNAYDALANHNITGRSVVVFE